MNTLEWAKMNRNQFPGRTVLDVLGARQAALSEGYRRAYAAARREINS